MSSTRSSDPWADAAADLAFPAHQAGGRDELDGVAQRGLQPNAGQHCVGVLTHLHVFLLTPAGRGRRWHSARAMALLDLWDIRGVHVLRCTEEPPRHGLGPNLGPPEPLPSRALSTRSVTGTTPPFSKEHPPIIGHCLDAQPSPASGRPSDLPLRPQCCHVSNRVDTSPASQACSLVLPRKARGAPPTRTGCGGSALCLSRCRERSRR